MIFINYWLVLIGWKLITLVVNYCADPTSFKSHVTQNHCYLIQLIGCRTFWHILNEFIKMLYILRYSLSVNFYLQNSVLNLSNLWLKQKENLLFIGISTLLCYLELHPQRWIENLVSVYGTCKVQCYGGPSQLQAVAQKVALIVFFLFRGGKMTHIQV